MAAQLIHYRKYSIACSGCGWYVVDSSRNRRDRGRIILISRQRVSYGIVNTFLSRTYHMAVLQFLWYNILHGPQNSGHRIRDDILTTHHGNIAYANVI